MYPSAASHIIRSNGPPDIDSVQQLQCKLYQTRRIDLVADDSKLWRAQRQPGITEPHPVEYVEELAPELQIEAAVTIEPVIFYQTDVEVVRAVVTDVRQRAAGVSESEGRRLAEHARVE